MAGAAQANANVQYCANNHHYGTPETGRRVSSFRKFSQCYEEQAGKLLVELHELQSTKSKGNQWIETARWIKYEERAEGVDKFWSKPRLSFLSFHSLTQLRLCFQKGVVLLDQKAETYDELLELVVSTMAKQYQIETSRIQILRNVICGHREGTLHGPTNGTSAVGFMAKKVSAFARQHTQMILDSPARTESFTVVQSEDKDIVKPEERKLVPISTSNNIPRPDRPLTRRVTKFFTNIEPTRQLEDVDFIKRLPQDVQGVKMLSGMANELAHVRFAMIRLHEAKEYPEFHNGQVPLRFLFVVVGPPTGDFNYHEVGRSLSTLMANPNFQTCALQAENRKDLVDAIDTFLDEGVFIPPVDIDRGVMNNLDEMKKALRYRNKQFPRTESIQASIENVTKCKYNSNYNIDQPVINFKQADESPLERTGKLFGGMIRDFKKRTPYYASDFKDAFNLQCLTSVCFMFFAALAPAITFGGLLETKTGGWMGTSEVLIAQSICGIIWSLFSAQPLLIMAATGPFLIFEGSLYEFCESRGIDFMVFRVWCGLWVFMAALMTVMLEGSFLIRYFTRFTEDIFASLVALIFIVESMKFVYKSFVYHPVLNLVSYCDVQSILDMYGNGTGITELDSNLTEKEMFHPSKLNDSRNVSVYDGYKKDLVGQPDTALLSAGLVIGTFYLSYQLRQLRTTIFLGRPLRRLISDFGVPIAITVVVLIDFTFFTQPYHQHLVMSDTFSPTSPEKRGWYIHPFGYEHRPFPVWAYFGASIPALLVYILIFVECELTQLLLLRAQRKLQKGGGFHWDLLLLGGLTLLCSVMGLPWMCAAVLQSLAHCTSLTIMKNRAPGQTPQVERVVEQRVTTLVVAVLTGACAFLGFVLKEIPIAVLFGVFLFLGVMTLAGVDMTNRLVLMFVPQKYFPDLAYCQHVSMWRMHLYTAIQIACLALVWMCKSVQQISLAFPFMVMLIALFRIFLMPKFYTNQELEALDGEEELEEDEDGEVDIFRSGHMGV